MFLLFFCVCVCERERERERERKRECVCVCMCTHLHVCARVRVWAFRHKELNCIEMYYYYFKAKKSGRKRTCQHWTKRWWIDTKTWWRQKRGTRQITATWINTDDMWTSRLEINRKQKWEEKKHCGRFKRLTSDISNEKMWTWLWKGNLWRKTESLLRTAYNNTIRTNQRQSNNR